MALDPEKIRSSFAGRKIAIIGDLVADQFVSGTISRVSREAPVFIMRHEETVTLPGAAANAAANVASLGGAAVSVGLIGTDANGSSLRAAMTSAGIDSSAVIESSTSTTTKVRVLAGQNFAAKNQVIRIDYENTESDPSLLRKLRENALAAVGTADAVIISDYGYGAVSTELFEEVKEVATSRDIPLVVDSRYRLSQFAGATSATPNQEEVEQILGSGFTDEKCRDLREQLSLRTLLITQGSKGMRLYEEGSGPLHLPAIGSPTAVDVTGAGDTVIAAYTLGLASGLSFSDAARIANHAGGIVVMKKRTASASMDELMASLIEHARVSGHSTSK